MLELDDIALLSQYTEQNSEEAFAALVTRHINKVYSVALRHTRNPHHAEEITQAVFVILANRSRHLSKNVVLSGWLYQTARLTAVTFIRSEIRRARREEEAHRQNMSNETEPDDWHQIAPLLDSAMAELNETDRHAVVLRFFDGKSMSEVGAALGASEDAAKMRLNRAIEKLRKSFTKHGVVLPTTVLTAAISANSVQAAPASLATSITTVAMTKGVAASGSTLTLIKTTLKIMAWTKLKTAVAVGAIAIMAIGTATVVIRRGEATTNHSTFTFAGYATPEATIQSSIWAAGTGDIEKFLAGFTPPERERFRSRILAPKSADEVRRRAIALANAMIGYRITQKEVLSDDEIHLHITAPASPEGLPSGKTIIILKRIAGEWKRDGNID
ncbi:MAG TPA: sigma-70 family RNA polymerase sigma factor [Candidatus Limnocylindria bacterium]|jgi:RNA polymerase sigma factor (sigma-70 family)|nr:sigma-70 family RNA polymerase sigma factor [Candidatus Limnocylindria bacterium]